MFVLLDLKVFGGNVKVKTRHVGGYLCLQCGQRWEHSLITWNILSLSEQQRSVTSLMNLENAPASSPV